jgi:hypothetical protein
VIFQFEKLCSRAAILYISRPFDRIIHAQYLPHYFWCTVYKDLKHSKSQNFQKTLLAALKMSSQSFYATSSGLHNGNLKFFMANFFRETKSILHYKELCTKYVLSFEILHGCQIRILQINNSILRRCNFEARDVSEVN